MRGITAAGFQTLGKRVVAALHFVCGEIFHLLQLYFELGVVGQIFEDVGILS